MNLLKLYISILLIILTLSCEEEEIFWQFNNQTSDLIVVEAILTNEKIRHQIKLGNPYQEQNQVATPVSGAIINISTLDEFFSTVEIPLGSGLYFTDSMRAVSGKVYTLTISYNNKVYTASAIQPPVEPMENLSIRPRTDSTYTINFSEFGEDPNYIKHMIDWKTTANCTSPSDCEALIIYYDLKNIDINKQFAPNQEQVNFPVGTTIIRKKYSVSDDYQAYLRGMLSETAWRGGPFDVYQANAPTNLEGGAIGFFAISTVITDTTIIE